MRIADFRLRMAERLSIAALLIGLAPVAMAQQSAADQVAVPLSDPSRPALIDVSLVQGSITVRGTNRKDVSVTARPDTDRPSRRFDADATGLRRIPQTAGFRISEEGDRKSTRLNSSHGYISYAVFCLKKKNI